MRRRLLERNETRGVSGTNTGSTMANKLVRATVLCKIGTDHLGLDFDRVEGLSVVDADDGANHLWDDDHLRVELVNVNH